MAAARKQPRPEKALIDEFLDTARRQPGFDPDNFDIDEFIAKLSPEKQQAILNDAIAVKQWRDTHKKDLLFPDKGPYRRELYPKHLELFEAGKSFRERLFLAANRVGKTVAGSFEATCHATGDYPKWWPGRKFTKPTRLWIAGDTNETTRDILQLEMFGDVASMPGNRKGFDGTGMVPADALGDVKWKTGVPNMADTVKVRHKTGGWSSIGLKSFDQGRRAFQGTAKEFIWLDEECPFDVYGECLVRTATTRGLVLLTFTPLEGLTETVLHFMGDDLRPD